MGKGSVDTISRTLDLLQAVSVRRGRWFSVTEIADATGVPIGAVHRYVNKFVDRGILQYTGATRKYAVAGTVEQIPSMDKNGKATSK